MFTSWYADDRQNYRIAEVTPDGETVGSYDPVRVFNDVMVREGWKSSGDATVENTGKGLKLAAHIHDLSIVRIGDKDLFVCPVTEIDTGTNARKYQTAIITDWK